MEGSAVVIDKGRWLKHCFVAGRTMRDDAWMAFDTRWGSSYLWNRNELYELLNAADYPEDRVSILWSHEFPFYGKECGLPTYTCVQWAKRILGIKAWWVQTVSQLERHLQKRYNFRYVSDQTLLHLKNMPGDN